MTAQKLVSFFKDLDKTSVDLVGGKGANLGEMTKIGLPVPPGFAITSNAYDIFLKENDLENKIYSILSSLDVSDPAQLQQASKTIQKMIINSNIPELLVKEIVDSYLKLSGLLKKALVAVRSSATAEDMPSTSFAGQQATLLNIKGENNLLQAVKECWASLFTARSIFYRVQNKIPHKKVKIAVIVQKMIQSEVSGVMFTVDPVSGEKDRIIIEAVWGLGEMIVQGSVTPDRYVVQKDTFDILSKEISEQHIQLIREGGQTKESKVSKKKQSLQKISDEDIRFLAKIAQKLQEHYYFPQDSEWAKDKTGIYIVQTRPITTLGKENEIRKETENEFANLPVILSGKPASPGIGSGEVKLVNSAKQIGKVKDGDVLVSKMTSPDFVPAMKKASAIVTDEGGMTSHAAIVSRELGVPCVVGTRMATKRLSEGMIVTVDGTNGIIYQGTNQAKVKKIITKQPTLIRKTATKLYVNLAEPEMAKRVAKMDVDGVGLLRAEFMMANMRIHPKEAIKQKKQIKYIDDLASGIETFCKAFYPRPVVYRTTDFKTNEYRVLEGGKHWEPEEANPLLGFRGALRYISNQEVFTLELKALKKVLSGYNNLRVMIPFVRSPLELSKVRKIVASEDLFKFSSFKFWMMVELPVNVILLDDFIKVGLDGVSIGSNDLTMLLTGTDRDNAEVANAFDERSPAVLWAIKKTIKTCNKYGINSSICGQAPSIYDDYAFNLVKWGITSISVNPDALARTRETIYQAEKELLRR
ncbi:MAG: phosphoenolpyruvate synthase [Patescibacteria group bacterium]|nr:MAG: phosphoenolpyruvate synthase [Patescibacteria group bacterium]